MSELMRSWDRMSSYPMGRFLFNRLIAWRIPYTGSIRPKVLQLSPGSAKVFFKDRRAVRNHLSSIHAIALMNIAEFSTGLALISQQPKNVRTILVGLSIEYLKKGRGTMTATCCDEGGVLSGEKEERRLISEVRDSNGDLVAKAEARWLLGHTK